MTIERYLNFTIEQSKKGVINPGLSLIFIDSLNFLNDSLDNLVKSSSEDEFYNLTEKYKAYMKVFIPMTAGVTLKILNKVNLAKIIFVIRWLIIQLMMEIMNMLLTFRNDLQWKIWNIITSCTKNLVYYYWFVCLKFLQKILKVSLS